MTDRKADTAPLSFKEKAGYGLGDMASNFYLGFFGLYLLYYYTDVYGLAPAAVATMMLISKIIDAVTDPGMGLIADRTNSRFGKYRPYLLYMAIPYGILGVAIFYGPELSDTGKLIYAYVTYIGVMLIYTAINVPYSGLLAVISPVAEERTKATTYRFIFASGGTLLVAMFATPLVNMLGGGDDVLGFRMTIILFAILSMLFFWTTFATTKERIELPKHKTKPMEDMKELIKNISWVILALVCIVLLVAYVTRVATVIYYVKYYQGHSSEAFIWIFDRVAVFSSLALLGQLIGAMSTPWFTKRYSKHMLVLWSSVAHAGFLVLSYMVPAESYWLAVFLHTCGLFTFGLTITLLFAMFTDCAEYGEWLTGSRASGLTVSASMFALKFGSAIGGALPGFILAAVGFVANTELTESAMNGIHWMTTLLPAILFIAGGVLMIFYKLDKTLLEKIEVELLERREKGDFNPETN